MRKAEYGLQAEKELGILEIAKLLFSKHGVKGFTRGLFTRMCYIMPSGMISMSVFESFKSKDID